MIQPDINYLAVLIAAIMSMIIGFLWYSKVLFGKAWMEASGMTEKKLAKEKQKGMGGTLFAAFIGALLSSYVLAHFVDYVEATTAAQGAQTGFWIWLGFVAPLMLGSVLWERKPIRFFLINASHELVALLVAGMILTVWV